MLREMAEESVRHPAAWGEGEDGVGGGGIGQEKAGGIAMTLGWGGGIGTRGQKLGGQDRTAEIVEL
jgi:hypothetical protein